MSLGRGLDDLVLHLTKALVNKAKLLDFFVERHIRWFNQMGAIRKDNNGNIGSTTDVYCACFVHGLSLLAIQNVYKKGPAHYESVHTLMICLPLWDLVREVASSRRI